MREKLVEQRKLLDLTQVKLAKILGISEVYVRKLESGERNPSIALMLKFEKLYKVSMKELFPDIFLNNFDTQCIKNLA